MRASRRLGKKDLHVSGAEGIYDEEEIPEQIRAYYLRAIHHSRGRPDSVIITIEKVRERPLKIPLLPVSTIHCESPKEAKEAVSNLLIREGISRRAVREAFRVVRSRQTMRGAALMHFESGLRFEPDRERGIRVSRLGIEKAEERRLSLRLKRDGINTARVKEALLLASKVASCPGIMAELCISDDPDYTTGYVASRGIGYVRITNIKAKGSRSGGRVFFVHGEGISSIIEYLERRPVIGVLER